MKDTTKAKIERRKVQSTISRKEQKRSQRQNYHSQFRRKGRGGGSGGKTKHGPRQWYETTLTLADGKRLMRKVSDLDSGKKMQIANERLLAKMRAQ